MRGTEGGHEGRSYEGYSSPTMSSMAEACADRGGGEGVCGSFLTRVDEACARGGIRRATYLVEVGQHEEQAGGEQQQRRGRVSRRVEAGVGGALHRAKA